MIYRFKTVAKAIINSLAAGLFLATFLVTWAEEIKKIIFAFV